MTTDSADFIAKLRQLEEQAHSVVQAANVVPETMSPICYTESTD